MKLREQIHRVIFGVDTTAGKLFDIWLLILILLSVLVVMLQSVPAIDADYDKHFVTAEWIFTGIFTAEYFLRIYSSPTRRKYIFSFFGVVDFLSILPAYLSLVFGGIHALMIIRVLRLIRVFRVLALIPFLENAAHMITALKQSLYKIAVFSAVVLCIVVILGAVMYTVEGPENGFTSIPQSIYWAIVTITTVGFGDITPQTYFGQFLASVIMLLGYSIIAVPTGIVAVEMNRAGKKSNKCPHCSAEVHKDDRFCSSCGGKLT